MPNDPKTLIICADGTWNTQDETAKSTPTPTNVERIARTLRGHDANGLPQIVFYESGVGTDWGTKVGGGGLGVGLWRNVLGCYRFLVHNYCKGDRIIIFGFSRGAYTARSVAGLIRNAGILKQGHEDFEQQALALYRDRTDATGPDAPGPVDFRNTHCVEENTTIDFVGVWDTVGALGIPGLSGEFHFLKGFNWAFHDVTLSHWVKRARHALAIHEHRLEFLPTLWKLQEDDRKDPLKLKQVWFTGAHSDVGGGYPDHGLSDVTLAWMVQEATDTAGLRFNLDALPSHHPDPHAATHDSFGAGFKFLDFLRGHRTGEARTWNPQPETCEDIHSTVVDRFRAKLKDDAWPETFLAELQRRAVQ